MSIDGIESDVSLRFEPEGRELCPDGACLGLIGPDGRCKVCGAVSPNGPPARDEPGAVDPRPASRDSAAVDLAASSEGSAVADPDDFDVEHRELCPDGACLGLIGPDGRCKVCGRSRDEAETGEA